VNGHVSAVAAPNDDADDAYDDGTKTPATLVATAGGLPRDRRSRARSSLLPMAHDC
jgi:hypothetical protein